MTTLRYVDPVVAEATDLSPDARSAVRHLLSFHAKGYKYDWRYKAGKWDGRISLLQNNLFPAGLVPKVRAYIEDSGLAETVTVVPHAFPAIPRIKSGWNDTTPGPLYTYQDEAVAACIQNGRGIVWMATGTGKTEVIARLIYTYRIPTVVIEPSKDLLYQTAKRLADRLPGANVGVIGDGNLGLGHDVTVALYPTLSRHIGQLDGIRRSGLLISDEAHHVGANTWLETLNAIPAPFRFGFSATPYTSAGYDLLLEGATGPLIYEYRGQAAIEAGRLTPPHVFITRVKSKAVPAHLDAKKEWNKIYQMGIVENEARNRALADAAAQCASSWGKTLVVTRIVDHGRNLAEMVRSRGIRTAFLSGDTPVIERQKALAGLAGNRYDVIVSTTIFDEGIDVPNISAVVLAAGGRADHKTIQRVGRGMRKGGADHLLVIDVADDAHPILTAHGRQRRRVYEREGWPVEEV